MAGSCVRRTSRDPVRISDRWIQHTRDAARSWNHGRRTQPLTSTGRVARRGHRPRGCPPGCGVQPAPGEQRGHRRRLSGGPAVLVADLLRGRGGRLGGATAVPDCGTRPCRRCGRDRVFGRAGDRRGYTNHPRRTSVLGRIPAACVDDGNGGHAGRHVRATLEQRRDDRQRRVELRIPHLTRERTLMGGSQVPFGHTHIESGDAQ